MRISSARQHTAAITRSLRSATLMRVRFNRNVKSSRCRLRSAAGNRATRDTSGQRPCLPRRSGITQSPVALLGAGHVVNAVGEFGSKDPVSAASRGEFLQALGTSRTDRRKPDRRRSRRPGPGNAPAAATDGPPQATEQPSIAGEDCISTPRFNRHRESATPARLPVTARAGQRPRSVAQ